MKSARMPSPSIHARILDVPAHIVSVYDNRSRCLGSGSIHLFEGDPSMLRHHPWRLARVVLMVMALT
jgi:hypothetical protein